jgi:hypothetical protein
METPFHFSHFFLLIVLRFFYLCRKPSITSFWLSPEAGCRRRRRRPPAGAAVAGRKKRGRPRRLPPVRTSNDEEEGEEVPAVSFSLSFPLCGRRLFWLVAALSLSEQKTGASYDGSWLVLWLGRKGSKGRWSLAFGCPLPK